MRTHIKLLLTALTGALVLAAAIGTASARRFEISNQGIRITWERLVFVEAGRAGPRVECPVTIEGTLHSRTISKVSGQLIGFITSARLTRPQCTFSGGAETVVILNGNEGTTTTLPWHIRYDSFQGTLPRITGIRLQLINVGFLIGAVFGIASCLYLTTAAHPAYGIVTVNEATGEVTGLRADETSSIPLFRASGMTEQCPANGTLEGAGRVTLLGNTTRITIRLVQ